MKTEQSLQLTHRLALVENRRVYEQTERVDAWWHGRGVVSATVPPRFGIDDTMTAEAAYLVPEETARRRDAEARAWTWHGDAVPHVPTYIGPGSLAIFLGSRPETVDGSVWFHEANGWSGDPADLRFEESNPWWRRTEALIEAMRDRATDGAYRIACPDLVENWDILASLTGATDLLMKMIDEPEWVHAALAAVDTVYYEVFQRIYELIADEDGSMVYGPFLLWGPGRTAKIQCDGSAMFSPSMFEEFVLPGLTRQTEWLDYSMYHLDGTQCIPHLDFVLSMPALNAVEWTPQAGKPGGTDSTWYPMYRRILEAGKSLQVLVDDPSAVPELLDAIGTDGVYLLGIDVDAAELADIVQKVRK